MINGILRILKNKSTELQLQSWDNHECDFPLNIAKNLSSKTKDLITKSTKSPGEYKSTEL